MGGLDDVEDVDGMVRCRDVVIVSQSCRFLK